jgi:hypothetical protein
MKTPTPRSLVLSRRRRRAPVCALALLALALLAPTTGPRVEQASGSVEIGRGEPPVWRAARAGDALAPGDAVRTGRDGRAEVVLPAGSVRLYGDSLLRLPLAAASGAGEAVELEQGSSLFDVLRRARDGFEVRTPEVVVSIKGTRFLVATGEKPEVAVFHGTVGLRELEGRAHELLVRAGFSAVGGGGAPIELIWSGAPDPWDGWLDGGAPPRAPESAAAGARGLESAKAAARANARRGAVEQALDRHPELAKRVEKALEKQAANDAGEASRDVPAAPDLDPLVDASKSEKHHKLKESYVEALLNDPLGNGNGGGGPGPNFDVTLVDDLVLITSDGQSWTFDEDALEDIADGDASFPQPLVVSIGGQGETVEGFANRLLDLLDEDDGGDDDGDDDD